MHLARNLLTACFVLLMGSQFAFAKQTGDVGEQAVSIKEKTSGLVHMPGFLDLYWDERQGRLLLRIDNMGQEIIYQSSMARGVGSNDLGLDRGQLGATRLVEFFRSGPKVLLIENNTRYRASSDDAAELMAVDSSFARSVVWGFERVAESNGSVLVDATDFFLRDAHGISTRLNRAQQGSYQPDPTRSAIFLPRTMAFPDNTEVEAIVSYSGERKYNDDGKVVSDILSTVVPDATSVTVHLHHSFIRLPDDNYTPLPFDPRAGIIGSPGGNGFTDYAVPVGEPVQVLYGRRHRLEKQDPQADISAAVEPIVYYLDPGAPEPIRSALLEGASWWNQAFEAAGYRDAFQVRLLPEGADPMDVRYNVIQWVHRSTRGWSYGSSVVDPRSGEILKGHVSLGSLRVRQDYLIAEGLLAPYTDGQLPDTMLEMSLARIRQLSAHEVGHTLGMEHNFAASVDDRSSVMDYPFPLIRFDAEGNLDLSDAYGTGIGAWDKRTVLYAYQDFPESFDEDAERKRIIEETIASGLLYVADEHSRDPGSAHPFGNLWDNGKDAMAELEHLLKVRSVALANFGERNIRPGRPLASIEESLVPIYLLHRFQIQAVGKLIGGQYFTYGMRADGQATPVTVDAARQEAAIDMLVNTLEPDLLALPQSLLDSIPPRPPGHGLGRESFSRDTGTVFDPLSPAASAISLTLDVLINPHRAARMNAFHASDASMPGFPVVLDAMAQSCWFDARQSGINGAIQRLAGNQFLQRLLKLTSDADAAPELRAQAYHSIQKLDAFLAKQKPDRLEAEWAAHYRFARLNIATLKNDPSRVPPGKVQSAPPGSPIGN
ncbi:MAG: zinc-dependent metalloprotease [Gammaproteobacteria bacterium]|nr:zinc-dependent metalloprotease [Gammaproteobacteria bacterium]